MHQGRFGLKQRLLAVVVGIGVLMALEACSSPPPPNLPPEINEPGFRQTPEGYVFADDPKPKVSTQSTNGLSAEYYDNRDFTGTIVRRIDETVNFTYNNGSPDPIIQPDTFSARWTGYVVPRFSEEYTFYTVSDDGVRLWVNGVLLVNNWTDHGAKEDFGKITLSAGVPYRIKMEFYENRGLAVAKLRWSSISQVKEVIPGSQLFPAPPPTNGTGTGLLGEYYDKANFMGIRTRRTDPTVGFDWGSGAPFPGMVNEIFSVRWTGQVEPRYNETYTFHTISDDGVRLWVNGQLLVNNWTVHAPTENTGTIALQAGTRYDIKMEYFEHQYGAVAKLMWSSENQAKEVIPQTQLYPSGPVPSPPTPTDFTATVVSGRVQLAWKKSADTLSYVLERRYGNDAYQPLATLTTLAYTDPTVEGNATYTYRIKGVNETGSGEWLESSSVTLPPAGTSDAHVMGQWSPLVDWPVLAIHTAVLPDGSVITWGGGPNTFTGKTDPHDRIATDIWDPISNTHTTVWNNTTELFCAGHTLLPDGRLITSGGHWIDGNGKKDTNIYDYRTRTWTRVADMADGRWYPTTTTLANGDILTLSGDRENGGNNNLPEVWSPLTNVWRPLIGAVRSLPNYPWMHLAPDGRVFYAGPGNDIGFIDTSGDGSWQILPGGRDFKFRDYGSSVMYRPGKILVVGGGETPVASAVTIDLNNGASVAITGSMSVARRQHNATVLPNGQVMITGGMSGAGKEDRATAVLAAEIWDPATGQFSVRDSMDLGRMYHSTAALLPDGRVLAAGGGRCSSCENSDTNENQLNSPYRNAQIYSPPYLFKTDGSGQPAPRPTITSAPDQVTWGQTFTVESPEAASILRVSLVRLSAVTHSFDMNQLFNELSFTLSAGSLTVTAPPNANLAPPGHYMLFLLNDRGVPSVAKIVQIL